MVVKTALMLKPLEVGWKKTFEEEEKMQGDGRASKRIMRLTDWIFLGEDSVNSKIRKMCNPCKMHIYLLAKICWNILRPQNNKKLFIFAVSTARWARFLALSVLSRLYGDINLSDSSSQIPQVRMVVNWTPHTIQPTFGKLLKNTYSQ